MTHRLSTIKNADMIFVFDHGQIGEYGTHEALMLKKTIYYDLVSNQQSSLKDTVKHVKHQEVDIEESRYKKYRRVDYGFRVKDNEEEEYKKYSRKNKKNIEFHHSIKKVYKMNRPEWIYIFFGCISSLVAGAIQPAFGVVLSKAITVIINKTQFYC